MWGYARLMKPKVKEHHEKTAVRLEGKPSIPSSVCTSYKVDWSNSACLFFLLHPSLRGRPGSTTLLVSRWNRNYPFPASIRICSLGRTGRKWKRGKKSASFIFPAYFIWFFCLPLSLCKTVKGLNNSLCAIHIYIFFFSFGKVKQKNSQAFPRSVEKFNKRIIFSN